VLLLLGHVVGGRIGNPFWLAEGRVQTAEGEGCERLGERKMAAERDACERKKMRGRRRVVEIK